MHALTLDFDERGRLVGIEVWDAKRVLPRALIDRAARPVSWPSASRRPRRRTTHLSPDHSWGASRPELKAIRPDAKARTNVSSRYRGRDAAAEP